jgi:hypothetical protein
MLAVTEDALARLAKMLEQEGVPKDAVVRLLHEPDGIAMVGDAERPDDKTFQHDGRTVLVLDAQTAETLSGSTLEVDGAELVLRHPEATT